MIKKKFFVLSLYEFFYVGGVVVLDLRRMDDGEKTSQG